MENTTARSLSQLRRRRLEKRRARRRARVRALSLEGLQLVGVAAVMALALAFAAPAGPQGAESLAVAGARGGSADAHSSVTGHWAPADSNGYVPEYYGVVGTCYDGIVARDTWYVDRSARYGPYVHYIVYDSCEMNRVGATSAGWARVKAHERAHARGFGHYEGSPYYNAAYYPSVNVY